jgi:hypothetical protein
LLFGQKSSSGVDFQRRLLDTVFAEVSKECDKLLAGSADEVASDDSVFELLCLLVSVTDSDGGRALVATGKFVALLISLLSCSTSRVQRQVQFSNSLFTVCWQPMILHPCMFVYFIV